MQVYLAGITSAKEFLFEDDFSFAKRMRIMLKFMHLGFLFTPN